MIYAVVADIEKKEHFVEGYWKDEVYEETRENRIKEDSPLKFQSIFSTPKEADREANRISKPSYVKGWRYNEERNKVWR